MSGADIKKILFVAAVALAAVAAASRFEPVRKVVFGA
jgi:hypothetical protein